MCECIGVYPSVTMYASLYSVYIRRPKTTYCSHEVNIVIGNPIALDVHSQIPIFGSKLGLVKLQCSSPICTVNIALNFLQATQAFEGNNLD